MPPDAAILPAFGRPVPRLSLLTERRAVAACITLWFLLQAHLVFVLNINWDEFFFLSHIHNFATGRLDVPFQTFYVHLFAWLPLLPVSEPDQVVLGRLLMLLAEASTAWCIYIVARALAAERHAFIAVLAYLASGFVMGHGASFRADPLAAFLLMSSTALLFTYPRQMMQCAIAGVLTALALLITIKSALYIPAFVAALVFAMRGDADRLRILRGFAIFAACAAALYLLGNAYHASAIALAEAKGTAASAMLQKGAGDALQKTVLSQMLFPRLAYIVRWAGMAIVPLGLVMIALALSCRQLLSRRPGLAITCLLLALPVVSLAIYRNAFAYFFPFIFASAAPVIAIAVARIDRAALRYVLIAMLMLGSVLQYGQLLRRDQSAQRAVIALVHEMFPRPVAYIDGSSMVPGFPKVGLFMSSWGLEVAAASAQPKLVPVIARHRPPLLIANSPALVKALDPAVEYGGARLKPEDEQAVRETYIRHWGPVWIAGREFADISAGQDFVLAIPGTYTLECSGAAVVLDGVRRNCGEVISIGEGTHRIAGGSNQPVVLRWGDRLPVPQRPVPDRPIYFSF